ncbi:MAG: hypothetical protein PQJ59_05295 [Spirochaetales bacterium]|nr:hypothetical protein [Spirochaetales bacterium]
MGDPTDYHALLTGQQGEILWLPLLTGSMAPNIYPGELLKITLCHKNEVQWGEVALFYREGKFTAHRIYMSSLWKGQKVYEKGDANSHGSWINRDRILGKVTGVKNDKGEFREIRKKPFFLLTSFVKMVLQKIKNRIIRTFTHD